MRGQGAFGPGEWTDDTAQMIAIALAAAKFDINTLVGQDEIARNFLDWYNSPAREKDIGIHTAHVLDQLAEVDHEDLAGTLTQIAWEKEQASLHSSGHDSGHGEIFHARSGAGFDLVA